MPTEGRNLCAITQRFATAVVQGSGTGPGAVGFVLRDDPDAGGARGIGKELAEQGTHAINAVRLDQGAVNVALAG